MVNKTILKNKGFNLKETYDLNDILSKLVFAQFTNSLYFSSFLPIFCIYIKYWKYIFY